MSAFVQDNSVAMRWCFAEPPHPFAERVISALGLDERWPEVFSAYASCKDAAVNAFGVPFEFWSLALFAAITLAALQLLVKTARGGV